MTTTAEFPVGCRREARRPFWDSGERPVDPGTLLTVIGTQEGRYGTLYRLKTADGRLVVLPRGRVRGDTRPHQEEPAGTSQ